MLVSAVYNLSQVQRLRTHFSTIVKSLSRAWLSATPWTAARQAPPSMGFSRQGYWSGLPFPPPGSSRPRGRTRVFRTAGRHFNLWATRDAPFSYKVPWKSSAASNDHHGRHLLRYLVTCQSYSESPSSSSPPQHSPQSLQLPHRLASSASPRPPVQALLPTRRLQELPVQTFSRHLIPNDSKYSRWLEQRDILGSWTDLKSTHSLSVTLSEGWRRRLRWGESKGEPSRAESSWPCRPASLGHLPLSPEQVLWSITSGQGRIWILCNNGWGCFINNEPPLSVGGRSEAETKRATHSDFWLSVMTSSLFYSCLMLKTCFEFVIAESSTKFKRVNVETTPPSPASIAPQPSLFRVSVSL